MGTGRTCTMYMFTDNDGGLKIPTLWSHLPTQDGKSISIWKSFFSIFIIF